VARTEVKATFTTSSGLAKMLHDFCLTLPYGGTVLLGGIIGFLTKGSKASLFAGGGSGALLCFLGYSSLQEYKKHNKCSKIWTSISLVRTFVLSN
jgi:uncharacterized membrane protein (UPF0136 family)